MIRNVLLLVVSQTCIIRAELYNEADTLYGILKGRSNPSLRPCMNQSESVDVTFTLRLNYVVDLDQVKELLTANFWMYFHWQNDLTSWKSSGYGHISKVILPANSVWVPDIRVLHSRKPTSQVADIVIVNSSGWSRNYDEIETVTPCSLDVSKFPFDTQVCSIYFASSRYEPTEMNITHFSVDILNTNLNGEWYVKDFTKSVAIMETRIGPLQIMTLTLFIKRQPVFYIINLLLPIITIAGINPLVFLVKKNSGEKVSFAVTLFLSFTVFISLLGGMLPQTSNSTSIVSLYVCVQFLFSGIYLMICVGIQRIGKMSSQNVLWRCTVGVNDVQQADQSGADNSGNYGSADDEVKLSEKASLKLDKWMFFVSIGLSLVLTLVTGVLIIS